MNETELNDFISDHSIKLGDIPAFSYQYADTDFEFAVLIMPDRRVSTSDEIRLIKFTRVDRARDFIKDCKIHEYDTITLRWTRESYEWSKIELV